MCDEENNKYNVPILTRGMQILEMLGESDNGMIIQEISNKMKCSKSSVYRIISTFEDMGYLTKDTETNRFMLSRKIFRLGLAALDETNILAHSVTPMKRLRDDVKESVMLGTLVGDEAVLLEQVLGSHDFTFVLRPGTHLCLHASAPGKVLVAYQKPSMQSELIKELTFEKFNDNTIVDEKYFREVLKQVKENGYATDLEEEIIGVHCIGAPIFNQFEEAIACVWVSGPKGRMPLSIFPEYVSKIKACADSISAKLGYKREEIKKVKL